MSVIVLEAAEGALISAADAMGQLRLDSSVDADQLARLNQMIDDAVDYVQGAAGVYLGPTSVEQRLDHWPWQVDGYHHTWHRQVIALEAAPVREVDALVYDDTAGVEQTIDAGSYQLVIDSRGRGELWLGDTFAAPTHNRTPGSIRVRYHVGFNAPDAESADPRLAVPGRARQALLLLVAGWFLDRGGEAGANVAADALIDRIRVWW